MCNVVSYLTRFVSDVVGNISQLTKNVQVLGSQCVFKEGGNSSTVIWRRRDVLLRKWGLCEIGERGNGVRIWGNMNLLLIFVKVLGGVCFVLGIRFFNSWHLFQFFPVWICWARTYFLFPRGIYLLKVNNRNIRTRYEICSKLTIKTPERRRGVVLVSLLLTYFTPYSSISIVNFKHVIAGSVVLYKVARRSSFVRLNK